MQHVEKALGITEMKLDGSGNKKTLTFLVGTFLKSLIFEVKSICFALFSVLISKMNCM